MHAFNTSTQEAEAGGALSFKGSLVYRAGSRTAGYINRDTKEKKAKADKNKQTNNK